MFYYNFQQTDFSHSCSTPSLLTVFDYFTAIALCLGGVILACLGSVRRVEPQIECYSDIHFQSASNNIIYMILLEELAVNWRNNSLCVLFVNP